MQSNSVTISRGLFPGDCLRLKYVWNFCSELPVRTCTLSSPTLADLSLQDKFVNQVGGWTVSLPCVLFISLLTLCSFGEPSRKKKINPVYILVKNCQSLEEDSEHHGYRARRCSESQSSHPVQEVFFLTSLPVPWDGVFLYQEVRMPEFI